MSSGIAEALEKVRRRMDNIMSAEKAAMFQFGERVVLTERTGERAYATVVGDGAKPETVSLTVDGRYYNPQEHFREMVASAVADRDMVIGDLLNLDMLKEVIEVEFIGTLWVEGDSGPMTPYVCEASFGDGFYLLTISTINQRPNYHVILVDSAWGRDDVIEEHIDEVIDAIEDECGRAGRSIEPYCDNCGDSCCTCRPDYETREDWPAIEADGGCAWGHMRWAWLLKTIGGTAADCLPRSWAERYLERISAG